MKKFLVIPILIIAYVLIIEVLVNTSSQVTPSSTQSSTSSGSTAIIGVGESISISVTRAYLFGLIRLPTYTNTLGNIGAYHDGFFTLIFILTAILIIVEIKNRKEQKKAKIKKKGR